MPQLVPMFLPAPIVDERKLDLDNDFNYEATQLAWDARGRLLVLGYLFYNYQRYDSTDDREFSTCTINVYGPDLAPAFIAETSRLYEEVDRGEYLQLDRGKPSLFVAADGGVALTTRANRVFFFDPEIERRLGGWDTDGPTEDPAAISQAGLVCQAEPLGDGRYLCVVAEAGVHLKWFTPNLICLSDGSPFSSQNRPRLDCFACYTSKPQYDEGPTVFPHVRLPAGGSRRPEPSLDTQLSLYAAWIGQALPLSPEQFLVATFRRLLRGGTKGMDFALAIVDSGGHVVGKAEGIDADADSPYVDHHYRVGVDRRHGTIVYKTKQSVFLFDSAGKQLARVALDGAELKSLSAWHLGGVGPEGQMVLVHKKQRLVLGLDPVDPSEPEVRRALHEAALVLKKQRTALKKRFTSQGGHWLHPGPVKRH